MMGGPYGVSFWEAVRGGGGGSYDGVFLLLRRGGVILGFDYGRLVLGGELMMGSSLWGVMMGCYDGEAAPSGSGHAESAESPGPSVDRKL